MGEVVTGPVRHAVIGGFRFVHEPLSGRERAIPTLGHEALRAELADRLEHSSGGAFLIGGFRGAGKTTLVTQVTDELVRASRARTYAVVRLDVARPVATTELMYSIMRTLFEQLDERGLVQRLPDDVRNAATLAYLRTTVSLATKRAEGSETSTTVGVGGSAGPVTGVVPFRLKELAPKLERTTKRSRSVASEISFLAYGETDVEHDFLRIIRLLTRSPLLSTSWWGRLRGRVDPPVHVVVVLDELDKLAGSAAGVQCLDDVLGALKNVLAASGLHVVFVAGTDLLDRATVDTQRGNGIFESVFAWTAYVPSLWGAPAGLLTALMPTATPAAVSELRAYLEYKARGGPRRLFQEVNGMVRWEGDAPNLALTEADVARVAFYARLNGVLVRYLDEAEPFSLSTLTADRFRLGAHYVLDWVLRSEGAVFVAAQVMHGPDPLSQVLGLTEPRIERLLQRLVDETILDRVSAANDPTRTMVGASSRAAQADQYRLTRKLREDLLAIAASNPDERAELLGPSLEYAALQQPGFAPPASPYQGPRPTSYPAQPPGQYSPQPTAAPPAGPYSAQPSYVSSNTVYPAAAYTSSPSTSAFPASPPDYNVPQSLKLLGNGRYELLDLLGSGGMGTVYSGRDTETDQDVAVKVLPGWALTDERLRERFLRESRIADSLDVPGVVRTHAVLTEPGGVLAIVMDLVSGERLELVIGAGLAPGRAVRVAERLYATVGRLHSEGLVRLDIKPSNIILTEGDQPVMIDLGLAKPLQAEAKEITLTGEVIGTPAYMAPEQFTGELGLDGRVDVYAVGALLFTLLGGDFGQSEGESPIALLHRRASQEHLPVGTLPCSPELRDLVATATARRPDDRFATADLAREALLKVPEAGEVV